MRTMGLFKEKKEKKEKTRGNPSKNGRKREKTMKRMTGRVL
jgi:hypothetical protein